MSEDTAFPKLIKTGRLAAGPMDSAFSGGASQWMDQERLSELSPPLERRSVVHPGRSLPRRIAVGSSRLWRSAPSMVESEVTHGHGFLFVPVVVGAGAAYWFALSEDPAFLPFCVAFLACAIVAVMTRNHFGIARVVPVGIALFLDGVMLAELETWRRSTVILDSPVTTELTGVVERREIDANGHWRYLVRVGRTANPEISRPPERVSLLARARHESAATGETISGRVRISPPSGPALPGLNDFAFSSYFDGIGAVGFFYGVPKKEAGLALSRTWLADLESGLFDLRSAIASHIRETVPGDAGAFAAAIVTDERRAISEETIEALRLSGLAHIIAISGLNMALAAGIFFVGVRTFLSFFAGFAQAYPVKKIAATGALMMATAYYLISGFGVSAERAYIMMAVMLVAVFFDRPSISLRNVALSALIIIAVSPSEILGPSFQMSFAATAALVAGYALWKHRSKKDEPEPLQIRHPMVTPILSSWKFIAGILATTLIGSMSTAIFSIEHFHRIATYGGLAANLAAMPIISFLVMPAGLVGMLLVPFGLDAPFLKLMGLGLEMVISIARYVAAWGGDAGIGRQHPWFLPVSVAGFLLLTLLRSRLRLVGIPLVAAALLFSWHERSKPLPDILVSEEGTMIAVIAREAIATNRTGPPDFIYGQWKRALLLGDPIKPDVSPVRDKPPDGKSEERRELTKAEIETARSRIGQAPAGHFVCEPRVFCGMKTAEGIIIASVEDSRYAGAACDAAHIIIAPRARFDHCRSGALMINGNILRKTGALEISLHGATGIRHWTIRPAVAGHDRPWSRHRYYDWRSKTFASTLPEPLRQLVSGSGG